MKKTLRVLVVFDTCGKVPVDQDFHEELKTEDWKAEAHVSRALRELGHEVRLFGVYDDIHILLEEIKAYRPDIVFNMIENFHGLSAYDMNVVALFELLKVPYTGTATPGLVLCKNKGITKEILSFHRIKTPAFKVIGRGERIAPWKKIRYPVLIKPLREEASYGISQNSLVENDAEFIARIKFVHDSLGHDAIAEEYIVGRELYVSLLGSQRPKVFPVRELLFKQIPDDEPKIATYKAKWDENYRKKHGIKNVFAAALDAAVLGKIGRTCKKVFRLLYLSGYARIDLRLTPDGDVVILEANPNPHIAKDEDFALSAQKAGLGYTELVQKIVVIALNRHG